MPRHPSRRLAPVNGSGRPARRLASLAKAAKEYDVSEKTVRRWISSGLIKGYRVGKLLIKVDLDEVDAKVVEVIPAAEANQR
jgi:excisionase family DNA binding protein